MTRAPGQSPPPERPSRFSAGDWYMLTACLFWALGTTLSKDSMGDAPGSFHVFTFVALRFWIASAVMCVWLRMTGTPLRIGRNLLVTLALVSFFGMFPFMVLFNTGLIMTTAVNAGILLALIPLVIPVVSFIGRGVKPSGWLVLGLVIGLGGILLMSVQGGVPVIDRGIILILVSSVTWSIYAVWGEPAMESCSPATATAWVFLFTSVYLLPLFFLSFPQQDWTGVSGENWMNLLVTALVSLAGANALYYAAIHRIGPSRSGIYIYLEPPFTVLLAFLLLGEQISIIQTAGFAFIILGVAASKIPLYRNAGERSAQP